MQLTEHVELVGSGLYGLSHELDCNVYLLRSAGEAAVIDAGSGADPEHLIHNLAAAGIRRLKYILLTHCHADHVGGAEPLRAAFGGRVVVGEGDADLVEHGTDEATGLAAAKVSGTYPPAYTYRHARVDERLQDGAEFGVGRLHVQCLLVPSHTPGSVCYLVTGPAVEERMLFPGDVLFVGGRVSVINVPGCELAAYRRWVPRLAGLGIRALYPGHQAWCVKGGQRHIDAVIEQLRGSRLPRNLDPLR